MNERLLRSALGVLLLSIFFFGLPIGKSPFSTKGEAREALVVKNMFSQENFILPLRNGTDIPSKPPLFHWLSAAAKLLGAPDEIAMRAPSVLAASFTNAGLFLFVGTFCGEILAFSSVFLLVTSFEWIRYSAAARVDMVFAGFLFGSFVSTLVLFRRRTVWSGIILGVFLGLAALTKGPAGAVIPATFGALLVGYEKLRGREFTRPLLLGSLALTLGFLLAALWYLAAYRVGGDAFLQTQLFKENISRLTGDGAFEVGHQKPFFWVLVDLFSGFLPWSLFLPGLFLWGYRRRATLDLNSVASFLWIGVFLSVFTLSTSKRPVYLIPIYPQLAFLVARFTLTESSRTNRRLLTFLSCVAALLPLILVIGILSPDPTTIFTLKEKAAIPVNIAWQSLRQSLYPSLMLLSAGSLALISLRRFDWYRSLGLLSASILLVVAVAQYYVQPAVAHHQSAKRFISEVEGRLRPKDRLLLYRSEIFPAIYYASRNIPVVGSVAGLKGAYIIGAVRHMTALLQEEPSAIPLLQSDSLAAEGDDRMFLVEIP